jgi:hypothetical protein
MEDNLDYCVQMQSRCTQQALAAAPTMFFTPSAASAISIHALNPSVSSSGGMAPVVQHCCLLLVLRDKAVVVVVGSSSRPLGSFLKKIPVACERHFS